MKRPKYKSLRDLLKHELVKKEEEKTAELIKQLRPVRKRKYLTREELEEICYWKSPRAIRQIQRTHSKKIERTTKQALSTRSERKRIELLTSLRGVSLPMASAILTLIWPERYGVIDIRVWKLLYALKSVQTKPSGIGFNFNNWYHLLCKLRYHAKELKTTVRAVERTLFHYHKTLQQGTLYKKK